MMTNPPDPVGLLDPSLLRRLEVTIMSAGRSTVPWLQTASSRLLARPGKRLRPSLVFAAAGCGPRRDTPSALLSAAAVELLHVSSLVHDDLLDGADHRGGVPTVHVTDGQAAAVVAGDYLLAAGGQLISQVGGRAAGLWHEAYAEMCEGQAREAANRYVVTDVEEYLRTIRGKTGALTRAACMLGGMCGGLGAEELPALATFGESFGVSFQILDDLMDVLSTPALWGKAVQHDLGQGIFTLPVLLAAREPGSSLAQMLAGALDGAEVDTAYDVVREHAVGTTIAAVYEWAGRARTALRQLPASDARDRLADMPQRYATAVLTGRVASRHRPIVEPHLPNGRRSGASSK
jgi:geranylgeranyl pyrophosphate synthase